MLVSTSSVGTNAKKKTTKTRLISSVSGCGEKRVSFDRWIEIMTVFCSGSDWWIDQLWKQNDRNIEIVAKTRWKRHSHQRSVAQRLMPMVKNNTLLMQSVFFHLPCWSVFWHSHLSIVDPIWIKDGILGEKTTRLGQAPTKRVKKWPVSERTKLTSTLSLNDWIWIEFGWPCDCDTTG